MPNVTSIQIVGDRDVAHEIAREAANRAFPLAFVVESRDLAEATARATPNGFELLVLVSPQPGEATAAAAATDSRGLLRWPVVVRTATPIADSAAVFSVLTSDWRAPTVARALVTAAAMHELRWENARLRGDLRTISRRFNHDLRTPLNCICTAAGAIKDSASEADELQGVFSRSITDSVDEAVRLIDRIGFVLKATATPQPLQHVAMEEIVWGAQQRLESRLAAANLKLVRPDKWPSVRGVPAWLDVIWTNLIANSIAHATGATTIQLGWERFDAEYLFWVRDDGPGVRPDMQRQLFHALDRLSDLNAPRGIGLSIVHRLVELQSGRCGYNPEPAPAGSFFFTLHGA